MSYTIELNDQRYKPKQASSLHLITGFAMVGVGAFTFLLGNADWIKAVFHAPLLPGYILGTIALIYGFVLLYFTFSKNAWLQIPANNKTIRIASTIICGLLGIVFALSQWWLAAGISGMVAAANLYAYFYEQKIAQPLLVVLNETNIELPASARRKTLEWTEVDRVILRHGIITIDCVNNFLYQWSIRFNNIDSTAFEQFCTLQIEASKSKRESDDW